MDELTLFAFLVSFIGIFVLFIYAKETKPLSISIEFTDIFPPGTMIRTSGVVKEVDYKGNSILIRLCNKTCVNALLFEKASVIVGEEINIEGIIREYGNRKYIEMKTISEK